MLETIALWIGYLLLGTGALAASLGLLVVLLWLVHHFGSRALYEANGVELVVRIARGIGDQTWVARYALPPQKHPLPPLATRVRQVESFLGLDDDGDDEL